MSVPYVEESVKNDAREIFATLMSKAPDEVPESLLDMWREARHMASMLQPGVMDIRHMVSLILIDRHVNAKSAVPKGSLKDAKKY